MNNEPKVGWIHIWWEWDQPRQSVPTGTRTHEGIYLGQHGGFHFWRPLHFASVPACPRMSSLSYTWVVPVIEMKVGTTEDVYHDFMFND